MDFVDLFDRFGEGGTVALCGLGVGLVFGALSQRSRFCMRAAVVESFRSGPGPKLAIWLLAFGAAIAATQAAISAGLLDVTDVRQLAARGSLSGAMVGGLMFGAGMVLARGCASRILILSATGNLRALVTGLILTIVAQASLRGILAPMREWIAELWTVSGPSERDLSYVLQLSDHTPMVVGVVLFAVAVVLARYRGVGRWTIVGASGVGLTITLAWLVNYNLAAQAFSPVAVKSISFIGPSADTLMGLINKPSLPLVFDLGLVPGVFAGSFLASLAGRDFKFQCFSIEQNPMPRYVIGAVLMGFGGMLAGGCAVGAVMSGGSVFSITGWVAAASMFVGGAVTDWAIDQRRAASADSVNIPVGPSVSMR